MMVPFSYNLRSLWVRRSATLLTVFGIGATVAVVAGVLALQQGFEHMYTENGRDDVLVFMRPGADNEGNSVFQVDRAEILQKTLPEVLRNQAGEPMASLELYSGVRRFKLDGGETNVPIRGVQQMTFEIRSEELMITSGRIFAQGSDEILIGSKLLGRIRGAEIDDVIVINTTPFTIVGVLDSAGSFASEIWGDLDRMQAALNRVGPSRVIAMVAPDADVASIRERLLHDKQTPAKVLTEREYLSAMTKALSGALIFLSSFLGVVMGIAAVFTSTNTMLSAISSRTREIGILLACGFRPLPIFLSFLFESAVLGLVGGLVGCLMVLPINGIETGTTNFKTFTEVAFAFQVTPYVMAVAVAFALVLGLIGGALPAWKASRLTPTEALRRV
ncbi:MAG: putative ABC transport system permease protein [Planctomycetota bacterium]|jgi:putative ABC transport system permease protein